MCVYNGTVYLDEALDSIRQQTLADIEIIVVDDGSTDGTPAIIARHAAEDARIRVTTIEHQGPAGARNVGLRLARTRYVALMDADDIAMPERLAVQAAFLERNPDVAALGASAWHIGPHGRRISVSDAGPVSRDELANLRAAGKAVFLIAPTVMLDRDAVLAIGGFRPAMVPAEDIDLWTRLAETRVVLSLRDRLLQYRVHAGSISTRRFFDQMQRFALVEENARRRRAGQEELDQAVYAARLHRDPAWRRANRARIVRARLQYRVAGAMLADRAPAGLAHLLLALGLAPDMTVPRLLRQLRPAVFDRR